MTVPGKGGRPRKYSEEIAAEICERLSNGESLIKICQYSHLPAMSVVQKWVLEDYQGFAESYARARAMQAEFLAEQIIEISDNDGRDSAHNRNSIDARKWYLSKVMPKKYGEAKTVTHAGEMTVNQTQLTPKQAADALLSAASEEDEGFDGESDEL